MFDLVPGLFCSLRRANVDDIDTVCRWMNDPELQSTVFDDQMFRGNSKDEVVRCLEENARVYGSEELLAVACSNKTGERIGMVQLKRIDWKSRNADLRYLVGEAKYRSNAFFGPEIAFLSLQLAFHFMNLHKIFGMISADNTASLDLARFGAKEEGVLLDAAPDPEQGWGNYHLFGVLRADFEVFIEQNRHGVLRRHQQLGLIP